VRVEEWKDGGGGGGGGGGKGDLRIACPLELNVKPDTVVFGSGAAMSNPNDDRSDGPKSDSGEL
jgi:hypothetical protein